MRGRLPVLITAVAGLLAVAPAAEAAPPSCVTPPPKQLRTDTLARFVPDCGLLFGTDAYYAATYEITTPPQHGTARVARDFGTTLRYLPAAGSTGPDTFSYRVTTADGTSAPVTQTITVSADANTLPTCAPGGPGLKLRAGAARDLTLTCSDADGDPLTIEITADPAHATVASAGQTDATRTVTVTPSAGHLGADALSFRASDGRGSSVVAELAWTVVDAAANTPPTCSAPLFPPVVQRDSPGGAQLWCQDADGDPVALEVTVPPAHGTADGTALAPIPGAWPWITVSYVPADGYVGPDSFTVRPLDGEGAQGVPVTVDLTVQAPPSPAAPGCATPTQQTIRPGTVARGALACWFAEPGGPELITPPAHGTVAFTDAGYRYTPDAGFTGSDSFAYRVLSAGGAGPVVTQPLLVAAGANAAPGCGISLPGRRTMGGYEEPVVRIGTTAPVRISCFDPDGDPVAVTPADPAHGQLLGVTPIVSFEGFEDPATTSGVTATYRPDDGFAGFDTLAATGADGRGGVAQASAVLAVRAAAHNTAPWCDSLPLTSLVLVAGGESEYAELCRDREGDPVSLDVTAPSDLAVAPFTRAGEELRTVLRPGAAARGWRTLQLRPEDDRGATMGTMTRSVRVVAPTADVDRVLGRGESAGAERDDLPTPARPATVRLTTLNEGRATIAMAGGSAPTGYAAFGASFAVTAPDAIPEAPLQLRFRFDASLLAGVSLGDVTVFRNGEPVPACTGAGATPNPCVAARTPLRDGDAEILVRTVRASTWSFGRATSPAPAPGPGPVDPGPGPVDPGPGPVDPGPGPGGSGQSGGGGGAETVLQPPTLKPRAARLRTALAKGLKLAVTSPFAGTARVRVTLDGRTARRYKLAKGTVTVARASGGVRAGAPRTLTVRFTKRAKTALRRASRVRLTVRVAVGDGPPTVRTLTVRR